MAAFEIRFAALLPLLGTKKKYFTHTQNCPFYATYSGSRHSNVHLYYSLERGAAVYIGLSLSHCGGAKLPAMPIHMHAISPFKSAAH